MAGVAAGIGEALAVDPTLVRLAFAFLSFASGAGIVAYLGPVALLPAPDATQPSRTRQVVGAILLVWAAILALRGLGLSDPFVWMLALVGAGVVIGTGATRFGLSAKGAQVAAIILIVAGVFVFVGDNAADRSVDFLPPGAVAVALLLIVAPWGWRLVRERNEERAARVREQGRTELAARVHDSVLQTLTLIQKEPAAARRLARRQERELRAWLYPDRETPAEAPWPPRSRRRRRRSRAPRRARRGRAERRRDARRAAVGHRAGRP